MHGHAAAPPTEDEPWLGRRHRQFHKPVNRRRVRLFAAGPHLGFQREVPHVRPHTETRVVSDAAGPAGPGAEAKPPADDGGGFAPSGRMETALLKAAFGKKAPDTRVLFHQFFMTSRSSPS